MKKEVHGSVRIFIFTGIIIAAASILPGINYALSPGVSPSQSAPYFVLPGLFLLFSLIALRSPGRGIIGFLRFLLFFLVVSNLINILYNAVAEAGYLDEILSFDIIDENIFYQILSYAPWFGIDAVFSFLGTYPVYDPGSVYTALSANIVSLIVFSMILKAYVSANKRARNRELLENDEHPQVAPPLPVDREYTTPPVDNGDRDDEDLIDTLYKRMMEQDREDEARAVYRREPAPVERPRPSGSIPARGRAGYTHKGKAWVLLTENPPEQDPGEYASDCLYTLGKEWGEGTILVQETLNPYLGMLELNSVIADSDAPGEASAASVRDSSGRECLVLYV